MMRSSAPPPAEVRVYTLLAVACRPTTLHRQRAVAVVEARVGARGRVSCVRTLSSLH